MSDVRGWKSLGEQFGELIRIAVRESLNALRMQPLVLLVVGCTAAISYETLYQLVGAHGPYAPTWWVAVLFPLQLDLAAIPGFRIAVDRLRPPWQRFCGAGEVVLALGASVYGNFAEHLGWAADPGWPGVTTKVFISVLPPVMCAFALLLAHMPRARVVVAAGRAPAASRSANTVRPPESSASETEVTPLHAVDDGPYLFGIPAEAQGWRDTSADGIRTLGALLWNHNGREPKASEVYRALHPDVATKARKDNNVPKYLRKLRSERGEDVG